MGFGFTAIILWEDEYGLHDWKAFDSWEDAKPFLKGILESGVDPAKIMFAPMSVRWMFPQYHNGRDSVWIKNLVGDDAFEREKQDAERRNAIRAQNPNADIVVAEATLGWLSPDGQFFPCGYGGHSEKAREIAGKMSPTKDAQTFLESKGWFAIYKNPGEGASLAIGTGAKEKKLSEKQLETLQKRGFAEKIANLSWYL